MTTPATEPDEAEPDEPVRPCRMCEQWGHMIRAAENRGEHRLAKVLVAGLTEHRARHHARPCRPEAVRDE